VSANDGGASGSGIGPTGLRWENRAAVFATTNWSVVLEAQGESAAAQDALEKLCRTYWRPVYSFIRRQGVGIEEAEDLTQGFFALLLERRDLDGVRREKGRLRSYLLTSVKHPRQRTAPRDGDQARQRTTGGGAGRIERDRAK
jgi:hypothetical protein